MNRRLLDVNCLLALLWPKHESHADIHAWFAKSGHLGWATNPLTQLGVLRLLTSPAVTLGAVGAAAALAVLREATQHEKHEFWPLDRGVTEGLDELSGRVQGHQQWTDAVLLREAVRRDGVLVTFDSGIRTLASRDLRDHVLVMRSS